MTLKEMIGATHRHGVKVKNEILRLTRLEKALEALNTRTGWPGCKTQPSTDKLCERFWPNKSFGKGKNRSKPTALLQISLDKNSR